MIIRAGFLSILLFGALPAEAHGIHADQVEGLKLGGPSTYTWIGAVHMFTGLDHLLFLFGVMFFLTRLKDVVIFISAFTLGHSVTLTGASLLGVQANSYLVDALIAISVIYKGFENLRGFEHWIGMPAPPILPMVTLFGLVHGFGLATRVQNYVLPHDGLLVRLLAFNLGVEVGQILALLVMYGGLVLLRRTAFLPPFTTIANGLLIIVGSMLFLHQAHLYQHNAWPDEFGFSTNSHKLDHYKNDIPDGSNTADPAELEDKLAPRK